MFASSATVDEGGLLRVEGGAWRYVNHYFFPSHVAGDVCGVIALDEADFGSIHTLSLSIFDEAGELDGSESSMIIDSRLPSEEMSVPRIPFALPFATVVRGPTVLKAKVASNGDELGALSVINRLSKQPEVQQSGE